VPIGLGYRSGGVPEPDPQAEDWWQGTAYPALRGIRDQLLGNPLEADMSLAGRDLYRFATEPSRDTALDAGLSVAGAALPFLGVGMLKGARNLGMGGLPRDVSFSTHEAIPYAKSGHLPKLVAADEATRAAYSADQRAGWEGPRGRDLLHEALDDPTLPTRTGTGVYVAPGTGTLETNPLRIARVRGSAADPEFLRRQTAANAFRGLVDAQGADPSHMPVLGDVGEDAKHLFVPLGRALDPAEARSLDAQVRPYQFSVADTGRGPSILNMDRSREVMDKARASGLDEAIREVLPEAGTPRLMSVEGTYPSFETPLLAKHEGTGRAVRRLRSFLTPEDIARLDAPEIRERVLGKLEMDDAVAGHLDDKLRNDLQTARWIIGNEGLSALFRAWRGKKEWLPVAATLAPLLDELDAGTDDRRSER
jgi:hypothetical protein